MAALTIKIWNCSITQRSQLCYTSIITPFLYLLTVTHPFSISIILFHNCINGAASYVALTYWFLFTRHGWWYWTPLHMLMCTQIPFLVRCFRLDLVFYSFTLLTVLFVFFFSGKLRVLYIFWIQVLCQICDMQICFLNLWLIFLTSYQSFSQSKSF